MDKIPIIKNKEWIKLNKFNRCSLYSMYSSATNAITIDPDMMNIPIDDHLVHRGDGVFESFKCIDGNVYNLDAHIKRLIYSCEKISLKIPINESLIKKIIIETIKAGMHKNASIRVLLSRGPGTMGIDPFECSGEVLYVIVYAINKILKSDSEIQTADIALSDIPVKPGFLAKVKSCNYLTNVLMKIEEKKLNVDYVIALDELGNIAEGATENIAIVTRDNRLLTPLPERVLPGTTAKRIITLAKNLVSIGVLNDACYENFNSDQLFEAKEVHIYGTTQGVVSVNRVNNKVIGKSEIGPIAKELFKLLKQDKVPENTILTKIF